MLLSALTHRIPGGNAPRPLIDVQVPRDGPRGVFLPTTAAHWTALGLPPPLVQVNCQAAANPLTPLIGSGNFAANGLGHLYQQNVADWLTTFLGTVDGSMGQYWGNFDAALDWSAGESAAVLTYASIANPGGTRDIFANQDGATHGNRYRMTSSPYNGSLTTYVANVPLDSAPEIYSDLARVRALMWFRNATAKRSGSMTDTAYFPARVHDESAYGGNATPGTRKTIGASYSGVAAPDSRVGLYAIWNGPDAEVIARKETLERLGWAPTWNEDVPKDGPGAGVYVPQGAADFLALGLPVPDFLWLCQETSGGLVPVIGNPAVVLAQIGGAAYGATVSGWTRKFTITTDGVAQGFHTTDAALDLAAGESYAVVAYSSMSSANPTSGFANRVLCAQGPLGSLRLNDDNTLRCFSGSATGPTILGNHDSPSIVRPLVWYRDAALNESGAKSDLGEGVSSLHDESAQVGQLRGIGGGSTAGTAATTRCCWYAVYKGANAEGRDWKDVLRRLGWSLSY